jgi:hypothetical protein
MASGEKDSGEDLRVADGASSEASTLLPMLVAGLVLTVVGLIVVVIFV